MKDNKIILFLAIGFGLFLLSNNSDGTTGKRSALAQVPGFQPLSVKMTDDEIDACYRFIILKEATPTGSTLRQQLTAIGLKYNIFT